MANILVVDDELGIRDLLFEILNDEGHQVELAENAAQARQARAQQRPDLVLLDIQMPKLSGFEVLDLLGERAPAVIFITAYDEFAFRAFEVHAVDYLLKPVEPPRLREALALLG